MRIPMNDSARRVMDRARQRARSLRHDFVGTEHLLLALLDEPAVVAALGVTNGGGRGSAQLANLRAGLWDVPPLAAR